MDPGVGDQVCLELVQLHGEGIAAGVSVTKKISYLDQLPALGSLRFPP